MDPRELRREVARMYSSSALEMLYTKLKLQILPFEQFSGHLPKRGKILDMGCGYGYVANYLSLESPDRYILGNDTSEERIEAARLTIGTRRNIEFVAGDCRELPQNEFDGVVIADVLHHAPYDHHAGLLVNVYAKLKPGGTLVMRETAKKIALRYYIFNCALEWVLYFNQEKMNFRKVGEWREMLERTGFDVHQMIPNPPLFPYTTCLFVCAKPLPVS